MNAKISITPSSRGFSLLEMMIALSLSAILFFVLDKLMISIWSTRASLEKAQHLERLRSFPLQLFSDSVFHAGNLGCRSVREGIRIHTATQLPSVFFIQQGKAVDIQNKDLVIHDTFSDQIIFHETVHAGKILKPESFKDKSDWILISDCEKAELLPYGGRVQEDYNPPVSLVPVVITRWRIQNQTLSKHQIYPSMPSQPVLSGVGAGEWKLLEHCLELRWKIDGRWETLLFELGNS